MALKATIFKADLQIADIDRNYYHDHALTIARHPSETDERMMVRLLAFALHAGPDLLFGKGLSTDDEPDLWHKDMTGIIKVWIDVGHPDERRMRRACGRAERVFVYAYGGHGTGVWWDQVNRKMERSNNLTVVSLPAPDVQALARLAQRNMQLHCMIQDGQIWLGNDKDRMSVEPETLTSPAAAVR